MLSNVLIKTQLKFLLTSNCLRSRAFSLAIWIADGFQVGFISDASFTLRSSVLPFTSLPFTIKTNDDYSVHLVCFKNNVLILLCVIFLTYMRCP